MNKLKVIFFGTPDFSVPTLDALSNNKACEVCLVVSMPDRPAGRGYELKSPLVIEFAKNNNIPFVQAENINKDQTALSLIESLKPDAYIVLAFAQFLGTKILSIPRLGPFNIHTSLLPKYRGAAPIQYALLNGDDNTGVSIQKMVKKMDAGDIAISRSVAIKPNENGGELWEKLKNQAAIVCEEFIQKLIQGEITYTPQNEDQVSFAPTIQKTDGFLDFKNYRFKDINNRVRAFDPWPGTYFFISDTRIKVLELEESKLNINPGELKVHDNTLHIGCLDSAVQLIKIQAEGKKPTAINNFLNGFRGELKLGTP